MHTGTYEDKTIADPELRSLFTRASLLESEWYQARLHTQQTLEVRLWKRHVHTLREFLSATNRYSETLRREVTERLHKAQSHLEEIERPDYPETLRDFIGADPAVLMEK